MHPDLTTARLLLRPLGARDLVWFAKLNRQPAVRRHLWDDREIEESEVTAIILHHMSRPDVSHDCLWIAQWNSEPIGFYGLWTFFDEPQPQLLYVTDPRFVRQGFAREASKAVVEFAFGYLALRYLDVTVEERNMPSIALARALGFVRYSHRTSEIGLQMVMRRQSVQGDGTNA